jgi:hypothetical protein
LKRSLDAVTRKVWFRCRNRIAPVDDGDAGRHE